MQTGKSTQYVLGAACKAERVNVERDIWIDPNADYNPIASDEFYMRIKSWDRCEKRVMYYPPSRGVQPERQPGRVSDAYERQLTQIKNAPGKSP